MDIPHANPMRVVLVQMFYSSIPDDGALAPEEQSDPEDVSYEASELSGGVQ
jgi:hypothetical protein